MSLNIRLKHSAQALKKPQVADLKPGELALNINSASPAGYALDDANAVQQMFGKATETQEGQAEIATQGEVNAGADDERIVTPKKLDKRITDYTANTVTPAIAVETAARTAANGALTQSLAAEEAARITADGLRVLKAGDTMTGPLKVPANASGSEVPQAQEVVQKTGDKMTGNLELTNNAKLYVTDGIGIAGGVLQLGHSLVNDPCVSLTTSNRMVIGGTLGLWISGAVPKVGGTAPALGLFPEANGLRLLQMSSSRALKTNIKPLDNSIDLVKSLQPVYYNPIDTPDSDPQVGMIAEEVADVSPALTIYDEDNKPTSVCYDRMGVVAIAALQKALVRIEALEAEVTALKAA